MDHVLEIQVMGDGLQLYSLNNGKKTKVKGSKKNTTNNQMELICPPSSFKENTLKGSKKFKFLQTLSM